MLIVISSAYCILQIPPQMVNESDMKLNDEDF